MQMSHEQVRWLLKVLQPEKTLGALPGAAALTEPIRAALLGLPLEVYAGEQGQMLSAAKDVARELSADPAVAALPVKKGDHVVTFGDSHTSDPQSWALILGEVLATRGATLSVSAAGGDTTTHALVRIGEAISRQPDWVLFLIGVNDARTQGPNPGKTLVDARETARNLRELHERVARETKARCLWITPPSVNEERVAAHWGLSRFGVRFRNSDIAQVAAAVHELGAPTVDLFASLGAPPPAPLLIDDGLHFTLAGQERIARDVVRSWSAQR
jgi:lysophospholipase L1-like esterase